MVGTIGFSVLKLVKINSNILGSDSLSASVSKVTLCIALLEENISAIKAYIRMANRLNSRGLHHLLTGITFAVAAVYFTSDYSSKCFRSEEHWFWRPVVDCQCEAFQLTYTSRRRFMCMAQQIIDQKRAKLAKWGEISLCLPTATTIILLKAKFNSRKRHALPFSPFFVI